VFLPKIIDDLREILYKTFTWKETSLEIKEDIKEGDF